MRSIYWNGCSILSMISMHILVGILKPMSRYLRWDIDVFGTIFLCLCFYERCSKVNVASMFTKFISESKILILIFLSIWESKSYLDLPSYYFQWLDYSNFVNNFLVAHKPFTCFKYNLQSLLGIKIDILAFFCLIEA